MENSIGFIKRIQAKFALVIASNHEREKFVFAARLSQIHAQRIFLPLILLTLAMGGCASPEDLSQTVTSTTTNVPTPTSTPTSTSLPTYTPTLAQTATPVFTSTPTATPILPVLNETPYPQPHEAISTDNVSRIRQLALLSTGLGPRDIELSANQSLLAIVSAAGVHLYDPKTLSKAAFFAANSDYGIVQSVALSSDGKLIATGDKSGTIEIWDVEKHQLLYNFVDGHKGGVKSLAFSPDGQKLVTGGRDARAKVWDLETGSLISTTRHGGDVYQVKFSADGQRVFTASQDTNIRMIEVESGSIVNTFFDTEPVYAMALSADGQLLVSGNTVWDISSGKRLRSLRFGVVNDIAFSKGDKQLAIGTSKWIFVVDTKSGEVLHVFDSAADSLAFLPKGNLLLSGYSWDGTVKVWDLNDEKLLQEWNLGQMDVFSVAFSPDGSQAAAGLSYDVTAKLWDVHNGELVHTLSENYRGSSDGVSDLVFSPDGSQLITAAKFNFSILRAWNVENGKPLQVLDDGGAHHVAFSADGRFIAWSAGEKVVLWDVLSQRELRTWNPKPNVHFYEIEFSPDSSLLAVFSLGSSSLQLWEVESGKAIVTLGDYPYGIWGAAFSPDGRLIAVGTKNRAQIWEIESGKSMQILKMPDEYVLDLAFSPSGDLLVTVSGTSFRENPHMKSWQIRFWQVESGVLLHTLLVPPGWPYSLDFSPDGRMLLTGGGDDGTVRLWGILP